MRELSPISRRRLHIGLAVVAAVLAIALAFGYYLFFYKSPEYRKLARDTDETQRALDALADDADSGASPGRD